jgi:uncharacterized protein
MKERDFNLQSGKGGAAISVRVTPRSPKNEITEILDNGTIKIRLNAPPVDGKANQALIEFLAKMLEVKPAQIDIIAGLTSKDKLLTITGLRPEDVQQKIMNQLK